MKIHKEWFIEMIEASRWGTQRQFAIALFEAKTVRQEFTAAGHLSKRLNGHIEFSPDEIYKIADMFGVSIILVMKHLGYKLDDKGNVR